MDCKVKFMKGLFEKMGCMKKKLHKMEKMKDYEGFKPHAYGPMMYGFAPMGYGPHGFGPHGHGPHGFGPHGHGPHEHRPHRHHRGHKWDSDSSSEEKRMSRFATAQMNQAMKRTAKSSMF